MAKLTVKNGVVTKYSGDVTELVIPEGVTEIGDPEERWNPGIFEGHEELTSVILPESLLRIGDKAFKGCSGLTDIRIPDNVTSIGGGAFFGCSGLTNLTISESVTEIKDALGYSEEGAFGNCTGLTNVNIPGTVTNIGTHAFSNCSNLQKVSLAEGIMSIGYHAFDRCSKLERINLPESITKIGSSSFNQCSSLIAIKIPEKITEIASDTFAFCKSLTSVTIPGYVTKIGWRAFQGCANLKEVILSDSITTIDNDAFSNCRELESIIIPNSVTYIGTGVFQNCTKLQKIVISKNLTSINNKTFSGCSELMSVIIPDGMTKINDYAFENCIKLKNLEIPESLTSIDSAAFKGCKELLFIGSPFLVIGTSLKVYTGNSPDVEIPEKVTEIQEGRLWKSTTNGVRSNFSINGVFGYHEEIISVSIPDSVNKIGSGAFIGCKNLKTIALSKNTKLLESYAFRDCSCLTEVTIPAGVNVIDEGAFENCIELRKIHLPESITEIRDYAFNGCSKLEEISLPEGLKLIGYQAFGCCSSLKGVIVLPKKIENIGTYAFKDCTQITEISIPDGITYLNLRSFEGCSNLRRITIPSSVQKINVYNRPDKLTQIILDPKIELQTIYNPEDLLWGKYEISPFPMIPISIIEEPEIKLKYFFEYCKNPEKYPKHIAEGYEKYGRSQRTRILREAASQNRPEVKEYYENKVQKTTGKTLTAKEKETLFKLTVEKGTEEELKQLLKKYKTIANGPDLLEESVIRGNIGKIRILLDHGIRFPEESDCFFDMLRSETHSEETKIAISDLCLSYENLRDVTNGIAFAACVLHNEKVIDVWMSHRKPDEYIRTYYAGEQNASKKLHMWNWLFEKLPEDEFLEALHNILLVSDPEEKPKLHLGRYSSVLDSGKVMNYILNNFTIIDSFGHVIYIAAANNQTDNIRLMADLWKDKGQDFIDDIEDIRRAIQRTVSNGSAEILEILFETGWAGASLSGEYNYQWVGWETDVFLTAIKGESPDVLECLIKNNWISNLPSSFSTSGALRTAVEADNAGALAILEKQGWIRTVNFRDKLIDLAVSEKNNNALAWLLEYKNRTADPVKEEKTKERKERKALEGEKLRVYDPDSKNEDSDSKKNEWKTNRLSDGTYGINRYLGDDDQNKVLVVPSVAGKRTITGIMKEAFSPGRYYSGSNKYALDSISAIIISDGIKFIEDKAFDFYGWLEAIAVPDSVISIGADAFRGCSTNLIIYGKTGSFIQSYAESSGIRFVDRNDPDKPIPDYLIREDTLIKYWGEDSDPVLPDGIKHIADYAFENCKNLRSITIPQSVIKISSYAFARCSKTNLKFRIHEGSKALKFVKEEGWKYEVIEK